MIYFMIYLAAISLLAVALTAHDKSAARRHKWRVCESTLLLVAALGGSVAMLVTMLLIRHKTKHAKFMVGLPVIIAMQIVAKEPGRDSYPRRALFYLIISSN